MVAVSCTFLPAANFLEIPEMEILLTETGFVSGDRGVSPGVPGVVSGVPGVSPGVPGVSPGVEAVSLGSFRYTPISSSPSKNVTIAFVPSLNVTVSLFKPVSLYPLSAFSATARI